MSWFRRRTPHIRCGHRALHAPHVWRTKYRKAWCDGEENWP